MQTAQWVSGKMIFRTPKTAKSRRSIELSTATVKRLKEHRQSQLEQRVALGPAYREQGLVFADATGETLHPNGGLRSTWVKITQSAGLPGLRFHDLRHAHASLMPAQERTRRWCRSGSGMPRSASLSTSILTCCRGFSGRLRSAWTSCSP